MRIENRLRRSHQARGGSSLQPLLIEAVQPAPLYSVGHAPEAAPLRRRACDQKPEVAFTRPVTPAARQQRFGRQDRAPTPHHRARHNPHSPDRDEYWRRPSQATQRRPRPHSGARAYHPPAAIVLPRHTRCAIRIIPTPKVVRTPAAVRLLVRRSSGRKAETGVVA
jgi:hypothetical protein